MVLSSATRSFVRFLQALMVALVIGGIAHAGPSFSAAPEPTDAEELLQAAPAPPAGWITESGPFTDVHAESRDRRTAIRLARYATEAVPRLAEALGVPAGRTMNIYLAPTDAAFEAMQPGAPPDWADGTAWPNRGLIYLHAPRGRSGGNEPLEQVLEHEIVHVLLGQAFAPRPVPRWLQEGMAQLLARQFSSHQTDALATGMLGGELLSFDRLARGFPADAIQARLAYAQSADLVAYIQNQHGEEAIQTLVQEMATGAPFPAAIRAATGISVRQLEKRWKARLERSPLWIAPLVSDTALFTFAAAFFVVGAFNIKRRNRATLARWEREEAVQDALAERLMRGWSEPSAPRLPGPVAAQGATAWPPPGSWMH